MGEENDVVRGPSEAAFKGEAGGAEPAGAADEVADGVLLGLAGGGDHLVALPVDPPGGAGAGAGILVLAVCQRVQREGAAPLEPARRVDDVGDGRLHHHRPRVLLPGPPEEGAGGGREVGGALDGAALDGDARVLVRVLPPLRRHHVLLPRVGLPGHEVAVL